MSQKTKKCLIECSLCFRKLSSEKHYARHMSTMHKPKDFICDYDGKHFNSKDKLRLHIFQHRKFYRIKCQVCSKEYTTNQSMRKHLRTHFQHHQCDNCGQVFKHKNLLKNHISAVHEYSQDYQCKYCTRTFASTTSRDAHQNTIHQDKEVDTKHFKCTECAAGFEMKEELRLHSFIHFNGTIHTCLDCNQIFKKKKLLTHHMKKHEVASFACSGCDNMFKYKSNLKKHLKEGRCKGKSESIKTLAEEDAEIAIKQMIEITKNYSRSIFKESEREEPVKEEEPNSHVVIYCDPFIEEKSPPKTSSNRTYTKRKTTRIVRKPSTAPYLCDLCGFTTIKKCNILSHIRHHISINKHKCINCSETVRSKELLHKHSMKAHNRGVIGSIEYSKSSSECEFCGKIFSAERIQAHLSLHMNPKIVCDSCGELFRTRQGLERHIASRHQNERKYTCSSCGKSFKKLQILKTHEETHNPIRIYVKCTLCCTMLQMKYLKNHMEIRHGSKYKEKSITCSECGKAFRYQKQLDKHIDQVHESTSRGIFYTCNECESVFNRRRDLRNHSFEHYSGPVFECSQCGLKFKRKKLLCIHARVHNPESRYPCKMCSSVFQTSGGRRKHMMKVHDTVEEVIEIPLI